MAFGLNFERFAQGTLKCFERDVVVWQITWQLQADVSFHWSNQRLDRWCVVET